MAVNVSDGASGPISQPMAPPPIDVPAPAELSEESRTRDEPSVSTRRTQSAVPAPSFVTVIVQVTVSPES